MGQLLSVLRQASLAWLGLTLCGGCGAALDPAGSVPVDGAPAAPAHAACPARSKAPSPLPNTRLEHESLSYWLERWKEDLDAPLATGDELSAHERALRAAAESEGRVVDLSRVPTQEESMPALQKRFASLRERFASGEYVSADTRAGELLADAQLTGLTWDPSLRVALAAVAIRCAPFAGAIRSTRGTAAIDRNSCSQVRPQEPIEILGRLAGQLVVRSREALGFIDPNAPLSPAVPAELVPVYRQGGELELLRELGWAGASLPAGSFLVVRDPDSTWLADARGFHPSPALGAAARSTARPLTRRAFLEAAFQHMGAPYGWGDQEGGRDCSRLLLDIMRSFGLHLPRHSAEQSQAGRYTVDVPEAAGETERLSLLDEAARRGVVFVHFPGHIMAYLGRDREGVPRALHAFAEYLTPCDGGGETLNEVGRVAVSDLSLGANTSRRSFLERMTRITVFGRAPGHALLALSRFRPSLPPSPEPPARCHDNLDHALFRSPRDPNSRSPLRVIAVSSEEPRPATLWLIDPRGERMALDQHELGTGPYARWVEVAKPLPGRWTALLADGPRVLACEHVRVAQRPVSLAARTAEESVWQARFRWDRDIEHLYSAFVEQLFSHPLDDQRTWSSLSELLGDPARNLLFGHLGLDEDTRLHMSPDCADLAYFLRAYFAWKLSLPFAFRQCTRGRAQVAPRCTELRPHTLQIDASDDVLAFDSYLRQHLAPGVHSASGRTLPTDEATDLYPLPLTREALAPGAVFADPYGHVIVVAKWVPQGSAGAGMMLGADAQPDGSVGRRRFFRGNFLFTPDTSEVGAGFKGFRPLQLSSEGTVFALTAEALERSEHHPPPSLMQYQGTAEDFYARMDELIYPRPIAMEDRLRQVVDAIEEQVLRRTEAIDLGEAFMRGRREPISMPTGYDLFETSGPWEDFATPSRDMRLLIALDAVRAFPARVAAQPERFGVTPASDLERRVEARLQRELVGRRVLYKRSDGTPFELTLADVLARATSFEVGYNPNDCVETRWGAPLGSSEAATCERSAPAAQRASMEQNRAWFHTRTRPARP